MVAVAGAFGPLRLDGQAAPSTPRKFESAFVTPSVLGPGGALVSRDRGGTCPPPFAFARGRLVIGCATLATLTGYAFNVPRGRVDGAIWLDGQGAPRFDIEATLPPGATVDQIPEMIQSLLVERLRLEAHRGTREQSVEALVVVKGGLKMKEAAPQTPDANDFSNIAGAAGGAGQAAPIEIGHINGQQARVTHGFIGGTPEALSTFGNDRIGTASVTMSMGNIHLQAPSISLDGLTDLLWSVADVTDLVNLTNVQGRYQLELRVSASGAAASPRGGPASPATDRKSVATFQEARRKAFNAALLKLGLQMEPRTAPVEVVFVDRVERSVN